MTLLLTTGLRRSELCGLQWTDIDLIQGSIAVNRTYHYIPGNRFFVGRPKTTRSRRVVVLDRNSRAMLVAHRAEAERVAQLLGREIQPFDLVFAREDETPWPPGSYSQLFRRTVRKLWIPARLHDLRHASATLLLSSGVPVRTVSDRRGRSDPGFTLRIYAHLLPNAQAEAAERLAQALPRLAAGARVPVVSP